MLAIGWRPTPLALLPILRIRIVCCITALKTALK
jgi:hypothetical protein